MVSPYIDRGVSLRYRLLYNQLAVIHYYESMATSTRYSGFSNTVYLTPFPDWAENIDYNCVVIGNKAEKAEVSLLLVTGLLYPRQVAKFRQKFNVMDRGENILFQNIAISPFFSAFIQRNTFTAGHGTRIPPSNSTSFLFSAGTSFGTRYKTSAFSYLKLFTSPQVSFTHYAQMGGGMYDPAAFVGDIQRGSKFNMQTVDLSFPVGFGCKRRSLIFNSGIAPTTALGTNTRHINRGNARTDKIVVYSHNFQFFAELGFHFRKLKKLERQMAEEGISALASEAKTYQEKGEIANEE